MTEQVTRSELRLASATREDLDAVMAVMQCSFDPAFGEAWTRAQCAGILPMSGVELTVAWEGERAAGFTLARSVLDEAELLLIAVVPSARGKGVGSALIRHFIKSNAKRGIHYLHLEVRDGNPAFDMYARHSFRVHGRRTNYYKGEGGQMCDALTMGRSIDS
jgi:ribosomal-protein-alanine N-acetyltransferase